MLVAKARNTLISLFLYVKKKSHIIPMDSMHNHTLQQPVTAGGTACLFQGAHP